MGTHYSLQIKIIVIGTIVNSLCILAGSVVGAAARRGINERYTATLFNAMGLVSLGLGANIFVQNIGGCSSPVLFIVSMALGGLLGAWLDLQGRVDGFGRRHHVSRLMEGLTTSSLLYCIGTFSIVGPILSALKGDHTFLFTNATLDLVTSTVFSATYGIGMSLAAPILFLWQGSIYMLARYTSGAAMLQGPLLNELCTVGGLLIISSGLQILHIKDCKTLNLLPALLIPVVYHLIFG